MSTPTVEEAKCRLRGALADVEEDNPVAAVRAVADVARGFRPEARTQWRAFRWAAEKAVRPYFEARNVDPAKAAVWAVVDPYFGQLDRRPPRGEPSPDRSGTQADRSESVRELTCRLPDPLEGGRAGRADTREPQA